MLALAHLVVLITLQPGGTESEPVALEPSALEPGPVLAERLGVAYPHPVLTEVLYAVPTAEGDATGDGSRDAVGDEFVELANPHDQPINLRGYTLTDRNPRDMGQVRFVFPAVELKPGEVAIVFNGKDQRFRGPVGDSARAALAPNPKYANAWTFTLGNTDKLTGFSNSGDWVLLSDPSGRPLECLRWGELEETPPIERQKVATSPASFRGSVFRDPRTGQWLEHRRTIGTGFSPGSWLPTVGDTRPE